MKTLMRNGRDRRSENPRSATRAKNACFWLGPISGSHQGQQPQRLHSKAEYMAAPERFAKRSDSFPLHRGRRPYMALLGPREMSDVSPHSGPKRTLTRSLSPIAILRAHALTSLTRHSCPRWKTCCKEHGSIEGLVARWRVDTSGPCG